MKKFNKKEKKEVQDMKKKEKKAKTRKKIKFRLRRKSWVIIKKQLELKFMLN